MLSGVADRDHEALNQLYSSALKLFGVVCQIKHFNGIGEFTIPGEPGETSSRRPEIKIKRTFLSGYERSYEVFSTAYFSGVQPGTFTKSEKHITIVGVGNIIRSAEARQIISEFNTLGGGTSRVVEQTETAYSNLTAADQILTAANIIGKFIESQRRAAAGQLAVKAILGLLGHQAVLLRRRG
jgi:hypothetical protein